MQHSHCSCHSEATSPHKLKLLILTLVLVFSFSLAELNAGLFSHSLALLADSGHMVADCFAIILALLATWSVKKRYFTHYPLEILAALVNGIVLVFIAFWIGWEAIERLHSPIIEILSLPMLATAGVGLGVNSINIALLHKDSHHDLNVRGVFLHVIADAASSLGVILAAVAVSCFNWLWADGVVSVLISALILSSAIPLVWESFQQLKQEKMP